MDCLSDVKSKFFPTILGSSTAGEAVHTVANNLRRAASTVMPEVISSSPYHKEVSVTPAFDREALKCSITFNALTAIADAHNGVMDTNGSLKLKFVVMFGLTLLGVISAISHIVEAVVRLALGVVCAAGLPCAKDKREHISVTFVAGALYNLSLVFSAANVIGQLFTEEKAIEQLEEFHSFQEFREMVASYLPKVTTPSSGTK